MDHLSDFIISLYPPDHGQEESVKIANQLEALSIEELADLAGVPMLTGQEKRAYVVAMKEAGFGDKAWLEQFEGSPLYQAAIQLCEQELEMRAKHLQERLARRKAFDHEGEWAERDQMDLQKQRLELSLHKHKAGNGGMPPQPDQPTPTVSGASAPPSEVDLGKTSAFDPFSSVRRKLAAMGRGLQILERRAVQAAAKSRTRGAVGQAAKRAVPKPPPVPAAALGKARSRGLTSGSQQARARSNAQFGSIGM